MVPDYAHAHAELKRPGVTLQLLWEEYTAANAEAAVYNLPLATQDKAMKSAAAKAGIAIVQA